MRAGLSTILQTLTPEAASVLNQSIAEASRRCHGQTTPLHVAATLLASPTGILRQACVRSHPNTSHPLQCRALELCFSVALDRLPSVSGGNSNPAADLQPPISNALMAALKRAQANQRRGCPEQQQQPLLAIKVELEQLIISILDDPSVSRVMREASFSSPAVKAAVEQSIAATAAAAPTATATTTISAVAAAGGPTTVTSTATSATSAAAASPGSNSANSSILSGFGFRATPAAPAIPFLLGNRNLYVNPRLQQTPKSAAAPSVGSSTPAGEEKEEIRKAFDILLKRKKRNPILVGDAQPEAVAKELLQKIERKGIGQGFPGNVEIIPVEKKLSGAPDASHITQILQELSNSIDRRLNDGGGAAVVLDLGDLRWLVERADGVSSAVVSEMKKLLARFSEGGRVWLVGSASSATYLRCQVYNPSVELDWDLQALPIASRPPLSSLPSRSESNLLAGGSPPAISGSRVRCPLEKAAPPRSEMCAHCKDSYERELAKLVAMEFEKSNLGSKPDKPLPPWLQLAKLSSGDSAASPAATQSQTREQELSWKKTTEELLKRWSETCSRLHLNPRQAKLQPPAPPVDHPAVPPASSVTTDLVLGCEKSPPAKSAPVDFDSFKRLFKGLAEKVSWQQEAASAVAATVMQCRSGSGRRAARGDTWLLFTGPDLMGKRKMAAALAALLVNAEPFTVSFGGASVPEEKAGLSRGRTAMDRVAEALRRNPSSVIVLDGIDSADMLVLGNLRRAMERARLPDSHGREVPLGRAVFILVSGGGAAEEKLLAAAKSGWQLELAAPEKPGKRRAEQWSPANPKPPRLSLDLNLAAGASDEDSSDLTVEHDVCGGGAAPDSKWEFLRSAVDAAVEFKPVDFRELRRKVADTMARKFRAAAGEGRTLVVDDETVDRLVGGLWFGSTPAAAFDEWAETVVVPSFRQLRNQSAAAAPTVKLLPLKDSGGGGGGAAAAALPTKVRVTLKFSDRPALSDGLFLPCN